MKREDHRGIFHQGKQFSHHGGDTGRTLAVTVWTWHCSHTFTGQEVEGGLGAGVGAGSGAGVGAGSGSGAGAESGKEGLNAETIGAVWAGAAADKKVGVPVLMTSKSHATLTAVLQLRHWTPGQHLQADLGERAY